MEEGVEGLMKERRGRAYHIAFWYPHYAAEFDSVEEWKKQPYRIAECN